LLCSGHRGHGGFAFTVTVSSWRAVSAINAHETLRMLNAAADLDGLFTVPLPFTHEALTPLADRALLRTRPMVPQHHPG